MRSEDCRRGLQVIAAGLMWAHVRIASGLFVVKNLLRMHVGSSCGGNLLRIDRASVTCHSELTCASMEKLNTKTCGQIVT
jgi:hypothetical protein